MNHLNFISILCILVLFLSNCLVCYGTLSKKDKTDKVINKNSQKTQNTVSGTQKTSAAERGLVTKSLKWESVVENHESYHVASSVSNLTTLVYVTPWNNRGYDIAKWQAGRFSLVSPVWLQLKTHQHSADSEGGYFIAGQFDIDHNWMKDVKKAALKQGNEAKFVPRLIFEGWSAANFQRLVTDEAARKVLTQRIIDVLEAQELDGVVLEVWSQLPHQKLLETMPAVIADISDGIREKGYLVILVIPPAQYDRNIPGMFQAPQFKYLAPHIDYFSLMTYDFSNFNAPGFNSPVWWAKRCVQLLAPKDSDPNRKKILLGMNLYGLEHTSPGGRHLLGRDLVELLKTFKPTLKYDEKSAEHYFQYKSEGSTRKVYYPSLYSIHKRVELANTLGTGLSLWEIGQGLDYFYDLI